MAQTTTQRAARFILHELIVELLYWPMWWYSRGLVQTAQSLTRQWTATAERLSLRILLKNMFRPMYSDYSRSGRIISFFFRIVLVITRAVVLAVWSVVLLVLFILWLAGPVVATAMLLRQLIPV